MQPDSLRHWPVTEGDLRGQVVIVHGYGEYGGRHAELAELLAAKGFAVWAGDLRGHGESPGPRGHIERWQDYLDDVESWWHALPPEDGAVPRFFLGHSVGGLVALDWVLRHRQAVRALVLSSPAFAMAFEPPGWRRALARLVSRIIPVLTQPSGIPTDGISSDPDECARYAEDPLNHQVATARFFVEYEEARARLVQTGKELDVPCLVVFGEEDPVISIDGARRFVESGDESITLQTYKGGRHELFHERREIRNRVREDVLSFLESQLD